MYPERGMPIPEPRVMTMFRTPKMSAKCLSPVHAEVKSGGSTVWDALAKPKSIAKMFKNRIRCTRPYALLSGLFRDNRQGL